MMIDKIKSLLNLTPHTEGGFFSEMYRAEELIPENALPHRYSSSRCFSTAIYYMLTSETFSALHRLKSDPGGQSRF